MRPLAVVVCLLSLSPLVQADSLPIGTWVQRDGVLTMTVEETGNGVQFTYKLVGPDGSASTIMSILSRLDGTDVPVLINGKPSGQTMGIRTIDSRHTFTVLKLQGKEIGTSTSEVSTDGKVLKVENDNTLTSPNGIVGKSTQY